MKRETKMGMNRTGIATSPVLSKEAIEAAREQPVQASDGKDAVELRAVYAEDADPIGTMPPPGSVKGALKTVLKAFQGQRANVFLDKLGERLAFERSGSRLYEGLIGKLDVYGSWNGGPSREELEQFLSEEMIHAELLREAIEQLGGDPTVVTPSADVQAVISMGLPQLIADPRTDLQQCLEAILVAELADNACWQHLVALARSMNMDALAESFERCLSEEERHLSRVNSWVSAAIGVEAKMGTVPLWGQSPTNAS